MRGRKPKPTALKLVEGNPGHRPINKREPKGEPISLSPPPELTKAQRVLWRKAIRVAPRQLLGACDRMLLTVWCVTQDHYSTAVKMQAQIDADNNRPLLVESRRDGGLTESPYLRLMHKHAQTLVKVASELGFTPSSRSRLACPQSPKDDAASKLFGF